MQADKILLSERVWIESSKSKGLKDLCEVNVQEKKKMVEVARSWDYKLFTLRQTGSVATSRREGLLSNLRLRPYLG